MKISVSPQTETLEYAAAELEKYLGMMDPSFPAEKAIGLSLKEYAGIDPMIDDVIEIEITEMNGTIQGSNGRSVLMGVYTLLKSAGCLWVRPGVKGEYIPRKKMADHSLSYYKKADQPFRGECIEGAVSRENLMDTILWLPKVNMNLFMLEQVVPYNYMSRWYSHEMNPLRENEGVSFETIAGYVTDLEMAIKKCGLQFHALGHGYLFEPYGIHYKIRNDVYDPSPEAFEAMAMINGERKLFKNSPNFTQPCMGKDWVRKNLVDWLVGYLDKKPYIDFLHVWLSDSWNNHCECEECRKLSPTDHYVRMLNELDAALTAKGKDTKIVFIMYTDTYWAPEKMRFKNPDRFIMTTAATGRNRNESYSPERHQGQMPVYRRNRAAFNATFAMSMSFVDAWKPFFDGRKFLFEYNLYTDHYVDPGYSHITENIRRDVSALKEIGFDGIMDDQTQRCHFPTALPMAVLGETLFNEKLELKEYEARYFQKAFGADGLKVREYLKKITAVFDPCRLRSSQDVVVEDTGTGAKKISRPAFVDSPETLERLKGLEPALQSFAPVIAAHLEEEDPCRRESWRILSYHADYCRKVAAVYNAFAQNDTELAKREVDALILWLFETEPALQPYLDPLLATQKFRRILYPKKR